VYSKVRMTAVTVAVAALAVSLTACSSSSSKAPKKSSAASSAPKTTASPTPATPKPLSLAVDAKGNLSGLPTTTAAGTYDITATSTAKAPYSVQLVRMAPGYSVKTLFGDVAASIEADKPNDSATARLYAKATFVGGPGGLGTQHAVVYLPQGNYVYVNSDVQGQPTPHPFTVTSGASAPQLPTSSAATVTAEGDMAGMFTFAVGGSLGAKGMLTFANKSQDNAHFLVIEKVKAGKTAKACEAYNGDPSAPKSPCTEVFDGSIVSPGSAEQVSYAGQGPGTYLLACFMPDPKTGKVHAEEGMIKQVQVA
jgi:hypothetical protein